MIGNKYSGKFILHWYSGSKRDLLDAVDYGFFFSINSALINSENGKSIVKNIPKERVLTETDGPFIKIFGKPAKPSDVSDIIQTLATVWGIGSSATSQQIIDNFRSLLEAPNKH